MRAPLAGSPLTLATSVLVRNFLDEVSKRLTTGKVALVAEIEEQWIAPLNDRMEKAGGVVFRRSRSEMIDLQDHRDAEALRQEVDQMQAEIAEAKGQAKEKLKTAMANTE